MHHVYLYLRGKKIQSLVWSAEIMFVLTWAGTNADSLSSNPYLDSNWVSLQLCSICCWCKICSIKCVYRRGNCSILFYIDCEHTTSLSYCTQGLCWIKLSFIMTLSWHISKYLWDSQKVLIFLMKNQQFFF